MKYLVVSDLHGSKYYINKLVQIINLEKPNKIILLGDLYSNKEDDKEIADILNRYCDIILCARGNCDNDSDIERCKFKVYDHIKLMINDKLFFFTHGHKYNINNIPNCIDVFVHGHLHIGFIKKIGNVLSVNSGSISFPRNNTLNSYLIINDKAIILKDIESYIIDEYEFDWM